MRKSSITIEIEKALREYLDVVYDNHIEMRNLRKTNERYCVDIIWYFGHRSRTLKVCANLPPKAIIATFKDAIDALCDAENIDY